MQEIQTAKIAADAAFRQKQYALAVRSYDIAINVSEEQQLPDLLHVLYSNRSACSTAICPGRQRDDRMPSCIRVLNKTFIYGLESAMKPSSTVHASSEVILPAQPYSQHTHKRARVTFMTLEYYNVCCDVAGLPQS